MFSGQIHVAILFTVNWEYFYECLSFPYFVNIKL